MKLNLRVNILNINLPKIILKERTACLVSLSAPSPRPPSLGGQWTRWTRL
jgi:hypothetical protein